MSSEKKRVLVSGSREWKDDQTVKQLLVAAMDHFESDPKDIVLVHGAARGLDSIAASVGKELGFSIEDHPADWKKYGRSAGHIRNQEMVDLGADIFLAFPLGESRGTRSCMERAKKSSEVLKTYFFDAEEHRLRKF